VGLAGCVTLGSSIGCFLVVGSAGGFDASRNAGCFSFLTDRITVIYITCNMQSTVELSAELKL